LINVSIFQEITNLFLNVATQLMDAIYAMMKMNAMNIKLVKKLYAFYVLVFMKEMNVLNVKLDNAMKKKKIDISMIFFKTIIYNSNMIFIFYILKNI
jgi:hypothetical protein